MNNVISLLEAEKRIIMSKIKGLKEALHIGLLAKKVQKNGTDEEKKAFFREYGTPEEILEVLKKCFGMVF